MTISLGTAGTEPNGSTAYTDHRRIQPLAELRSAIAPFVTSDSHFLTFPSYPVPPTALLDWQGTVEESDDVASLLALLELAGFAGAAERIAALSRPGGDLEDDEEPASIEAIKAFALTVRDLIGLGEPLIALSDGGSLIAEWHIATDKHIAVKFLGENRVAFSLIAPATGNRIRARLNGSGTRPEVIRAMRAFGIGSWRQHEG